MKAGLLRTQFSYQNTVVREKMKEKTKESVSAVVPIMLIVLLLGFTIAPLSPSILVEFIVGAVLVIIRSSMFIFSLCIFNSFESAIASTISSFISLVSLFVSLSII